MFFFHSAIYNLKLAYISFKNSIPLQLTSVLWSLLHLWPVKKEEIEAFFLTPWCCACLKISQFTNTRSIHSAFYQTKGAVRAVCALLRIWQLSA
jgi:hypothetical protein